MERKEDDEHENADKSKVKSKLNFRNANVNELNELNELIDKGELENVNQTSNDRGYSSDSDKFDSDLSNLYFDEKQTKQNLASLDDILKDEIISVTPIIVEDKSYEFNNFQLEKNIELENKVNFLAEELSNLKAKFNSPTSNLIKSPREVARERALSNWDEITKHINKWFYKADLEALLISLCCGICHYNLDSPPVWLFVIGPPGTGKTMVCINSLSILPFSQIESDLTSKSLLSGFTANPHNSMLKRLRGKFPEFITDSNGNKRKVKDWNNKNHGILLFKDFTTFLHKDIKERQQIATYLREIYDGRFSRIVGSSSTQILWQGKLSIIAAVTGEVEKAWGLMRAMGERFMQVRWGRLEGEDAIIAGDYARKQLGFESEIVEGMLEKSVKLVDMGNLEFISIPDKLDRGIYSLAEIVAVLRAHVDRSNDNRKVITDIPEPEAGTRLTLSVVQIARSFASMFRKEKIEKEDFKFAARIAIDSIPRNRRMVFDAFPKNGSVIEISDIEEMIRTPKSTIRWICEELEALKVIEIELDSQGKNVSGVRKGSWRMRMSENFVKLRLDSEWLWS